MISTKLKYIAVSFLCVATACNTSPQKEEVTKENSEVSTTEKQWMIGPFERPENAQPIIQLDTTATFDDPMTGEEVVWQSMATFNPAAIVKDGKINVLYRAEQDRHTDSIGGHTSRIGLATSEDGITYERAEKPIFYPDNDDQKEFEWTGGTEDPRIVESEDGTYVLTYTQWNRKIPRLALATSKDLKNWTKHGPVFQDFQDGKYHDMDTKSGAIVTRLKDGKLVATKINGKYYMYFGVPHIWLATSTDLVDWEPVEDYAGNLAPVLSPRPGYFDSWLVEAGPPPVLTEDGIVVLYNAGNSKNIGVEDLGNRVYTSGQALFDANEPWKLLDRTDKPYLKPELPFEKSGQYKDGTTFVEGLTYFDGKWYLFYGTADSMVGMATAEAK
ncbi:glycoside hydrolase family 130 protein [Autumnicola psychrophila]|uniref:Glycoside hydrolase family 130 protein n=1 Tax=Autumnicola psychrophila TaxID=3075592 RepID=A0ABU3DQD0_9FLAO|nr:glycoside hydrolase family 130 protein [Zunongwangia sp. F225]MDT0685923.1 glycoside hydrolase family 130 protein [Zunongwangia sp. F225]